MILINASQETRIGNELYVVIEYLSNVHKYITISAYDGKDKKGMQFLPLILRLYPTALIIFMSDIQHLLWYA